MGMIANALRELLAAGLVGDALADAIERIEDAPKKRTAGAIRQQRYRDKQASLVTSRDAVTSPPIPPSNGFPTPLPITTPQPHAAPESAHPTRSELERQFFARGKQVCGKNSGGMLSNLLKAKGQDIAAARAVIETAATKQDPREYVAACCKPGGPPPELPLNHQGIPYDPREGIL